MLHLFIPSPSHLTVTMDTTSTTIEQIQLKKKKKKKKNNKVLTRNYLLKLKLFAWETKRSKNLINSDYKRFVFLFAVPTLNCA